MERTDAKIDVSDYQRITLEELDETGAVRLIEGIVEQAARDYRRAKKIGAKWLKKDCEKFFKSAYFERLTGLNGRAVVEALDRI